MNDKKNTLIVLLLISAALLSTMLLVAHQTSQSAQGGDTAARFGDYIMCPGARESDMDNVYVIDVRQQRLIAYMLEPGTTDVKPVDMIDLQRYFAK